MYIFFDVIVSVRVVGTVAVVITIATHLFTNNNVVRLAVALAVLAIIVFVPTTAHNYSQVNLSLDNFWNVPLDTICNTIIFIPTAYYLGLTIRWQWCIILVITATVVIELLQLFIAGRVTDISDIVANSIGGVVGISLANIVSRHKRETVQ